MAGYFSLRIGLVKLQTVHSRSLGQWRKSRGIYFLTGRLEDAKTRRLED